MDYIWDDISGLWDDISGYKWNIDTTWYNWIEVDDINDDIWWQNSGIFIINTTVYCTSGYEAGYKLMMMMMMMMMMI